MSQSAPNDRSTTTLFNVLTGSLAAATIAGTLLLSELRPAWAQQAFVAGDSGPGEGGAMFVMPAFPNRFDALLRPDFSRRDVPLFREHLNLDEDQMYVLEVLVDSYTEEFRAAVDAFRDVQKRYRLKLPGMDGEMLPFDPFGEPGGIMHLGEGEGGEHDVFHVGDFHLALDSPGQVQIAVTRNVDVDVNADGNGDGAPKVAVAFEMTDENGESVLTEEQIKEITERISEQIKERMAEVEARRQELQAAREAAAASGAAAPTEKVPAATAEEVAKAGRALIAERNRLRDQFVQDVTLLLNDEQKEKWPQFERTHRRISTMRFGQFGGESVDVLRVINQQQPEIADQSAFAAAREMYETTLDDALTRRNELLPEHEIEMLLATEEMMQKQSMDDEERLDLMDRVADARVAVRDANLNALHAIGPLIAAEDRAEFRESVLREAYPFVYGSSSTQRSLEAALALEDLDDETRAAISELRADFEAQVNSLNDRIAAAIRKEEPRQHRQMLSSIEKIRDLEAMREAGGQIDFHALDLGPDESLELINERRALGRRVNEQLRGMLTEEQLKQLPAQRRVPFFGPGGPPPPGAQGVRVIKTESKSAQEPIQSEQ